jgi:tight adherence protein C
LLDGDRSRNDEEDDFVRLLIRQAAMLDQVVARFSDAHFLAVLFAAIGAAATVLTAAMPWLQPDTMARRIKAVSSERERIRARERERLQAAQSKTSIRVRPSGLIKQLVETLNLSSWLSTERAKTQLAMAGFRGAGAEYAFLAFRLAAPIAFFVVVIVYEFLILHWNQPLIIKIGAAIAASYLGIKTPELFLRNKTIKRQQELERAFPNTLDLLLICAESGMSIEHAVSKVGQEIGIESVAMAEEMGLLAAEMSYLTERRTAFENLGARTGLESIRSLATVLSQAERYGTPLGAALRVLSQESRDQRMTAAEKKAAALPPTLTVPMILFFLPGLFAAILTPAMIQINGWN